MAVVPQVDWVLLRRRGAKLVPLIAVLTLDLMPTQSARANAVVTLCQSDNQSGPAPGLNLGDALLKIDPSNQINTVTFQCPNGSATIQITKQHVISQWTVIDGGSNNIVLDGGGNHSMFAPDSSVALFLNNLSVRNAKAKNCSPLGCYGSVVAGGRSLQVNHSHIENSGGAILMNAGSMLGVDETDFVASSILSAGIQTTIGHSRFQTPGVPPIIAGGIVNISDSTFVNSDASHFENCQQFTINRGTFTANTINGALRIGCSSTISNSIFQNNSGTDGGAIFFTATASAISLREVRFLSNKASGTGGAIAFEYPNVNRKVVLSYGIFTGNKATTGGAIAVRGTLTSSSSPGLTSISAKVVSFSHNTATADGGAIHGNLTQMEIARGVFAHNIAFGSGGAIALRNVPKVSSTFANTLFIVNTAVGGMGSAFYGDDACFIYSTIDSNNGVAISISSPRLEGPEPITFLSTIISNNTQGCGPSAAVGRFKDGLNNLQWPGNDCASITQLDPHLDSMYIPLPKSPAMGKGDPALCTANPINGRDVYGLGRPSGTRCTIGAAEGDIELLVNRRLRGNTDKAAKQLFDYLQKVLPK